MNDIRKQFVDLKLNNITVRPLAYLALFVAAVALATLIKVPGLNTSYYNLGEVFIYTIALVFGKRAGLIAGAFGSALVDLILAPIWAPFTFVIKGVEGWAVGKIANDSRSSKILALIAGGHIMIVGYAVAVGLLYGWPAVLPEIGGNYGQAAVGAIIAMPLASQINKILRDK